MNCVNESQRVDAVHWSLSCKDSLSVSFSCSCARFFMMFFSLLVACGSGHQSSTTKTPAISEDRPTEHEVISTPTYGVFFANQKSLDVQKTPRNLQEEKEALIELYKGPTPDEKKDGLALIACGTTGARLLSIREGLATVQLEGGCSGCGSVGIYDSITATLKQFPTISYVHLLDTQGKTQAVSDTQDARPACLEP
ncbi:MAG: GerMN domain-containing protein [Myxococcota bacterium]|nr:GerMN domain-containing protein [Myxococcota bacterium]